MRFLIALLIVSPCVAARDTSPRRGAADPRLFKLIRTFGSGGVRANILSPAGRHIAVYNGNNVVVTDTLTGKEVFTLSGHGQNIHDGGWSRNGRVLATSGYDGVVKLWDVTTGKEIQSVSAHAGYA